MLSITSDYKNSRGCPEPYLRKIAEAGFTHVHWCHQWDTDFLYSDHEIEEARLWLVKFGLGVLDIHASAGVEKNWCSLHEYQRQAGLELVRNRLRMADRLGAGVIIMHVPRPPKTSHVRQGFEAALRRSLDELEPVVTRAGLKIAIENMPADNFKRLRQLFKEYPADFLGLCYDSGHGNIGADGLAELDRVRDRLISVHLHDNDGSGDQHLVPFAGTVDWPRLARIVGDSSYTKCVSLEVSMQYYNNHQPITERNFLRKAFKTGTKLTEMIERAKRHDVVFD